MTTQQALIDGIVEEPDAIDRWIVYADWLLEHGDARGELINLELAVENGLAEPDATARIHELVSDEDALLSPRLAAQAHFWYFVFRRGFIHEAQLIGAADDPPTGEALEALFADPHAGLIDKLDLGRYGEIQQVLVERARRGVRRLHLGECVIDAFHQLPDLEALEIGFGNPNHVPLDREEFSPAHGLDALEHRNLRSLTTRITARLAGHLNVSLPSLTHLTATGSDCSQLAHDQVVELLCGPCAELATPRLVALWCTLVRDAVAAPTSFLHRPPPRLTRVALYTSLEPAELAACLAGSALLRQLEHLTLTCPDNRALVAEVVAHAEDFRRLVSLTLGPVQSSHPAFPTTQFSILEPVEEPVFLATETDAESRRLDDGRIDAVAAFERDWT